MSETSPASLIAELDAALVDAGTPVVFRRYTSITPPRTKTEITINASIRPRASKELVDGVYQVLSDGVISPTGLASVLPIVEGDKIVLAGRELHIHTPKPIWVQGQTVRIGLVVQG